MYEAFTYILLFRRKCPVHCIAHPPSPFVSLFLSIETKTRTGAASYDAMLQQQFDALTRLLEDGHPQVRAVAAKVCTNTDFLFFAYHCVRENIARLCPAPRLPPTCTTCMCVHKSAVVRGVDFLFTGVSLSVLSVCGAVSRCRWVVHGSRGERAELWSIRSEFCVVSHKKKCCCKRHTWLLRSCPSCFRSCSSGLPKFLLTTDRIVVGRIIFKVSRSIEIE